MQPEKTACACIVRKINEKKMNAMKYAQRKLSDQYLFRVERVMRTKCCNFISRIIMMIEGFSSKKNVA